LNNKGVIYLLNTGNILGRHRTPSEDRGDDLYETSPVAVEALIKHVKLPKRIWEPACGKSCNIVTTLRNAGHIVLATDLTDYKWSENLLAMGNRDFLKESPHQTFGIEAIVTNPPFKYAHEFVQHARKLCPLTIMLLRLAFIESVKRNDILDSGDLRQILVFRNRLPMMHLDGFEGNKNNSSAMAFAWFVWDRSYNGKATIERISWEQEKSKGL
jgi:hypothetical protein